MRQSLSPGESVAWKTAKSLLARRASRQCAGPRQDELPRRPEDLRERVVSWVV